MTIDAPAVQSTVTMVMGLASTVAFLTWFIAGQFSKSRRDFYRIMSLHNREDDDRFLAIQEAQRELREYVARRDGTKIPHPKSFPRRRYFDGGTNSETGQAS